LEVCFQEFIPIISKSHVDFVFADVSYFSNQ
jgi:hypothetical protein